MVLDGYDVDADDDDDDVEVLSFRERVVIDDNGVGVCSGDCEFLDEVGCAVDRIETVELVDEDKEEEEEEEEER